MGRTIASTVMREVTKDRLLYSYTSLSCIIEVYFKALMGLHLYDRLVPYTIEIIYKRTLDDKLNLRLIFEPRVIRIRLLITLKISGLIGVISRMHGHYSMHRLS